MQEKGGIMELFRLFGKIAVENTEANEAIDDTTDKAEKSKSKLVNAFSKIGSIVAEVGKVATVATATVATAIVTLTAHAVGAYADYEQLVGGVETLFGAGGQSVEEYAQSVGKSVEEVKGKYSDLMKAQNDVLDNADKAYKTAGLSANAYMDTVTSFSAALISSLNGDTVKAAEVADRAIVDMSDNANKMGTSMESIQNAYQGFAKQNYTMLDNLKLGYGGTKEEMERLLNDAGKLANQKFDLSSFADIVEAIHVVQDNMGITGTTAKEAATTIQGSIGMLKASWMNFITALADENADMSTVMDSVVDSFVTVIENIAPKIIEVLPKITGALEYIVGGIAGYLPDLLNQLLPSLLNSVAMLLSGIIVNLPALIATLGSALWNALVLMFNEIGAMLPETASSSFSCIIQVFQGIWEFCKTIWDTIGKPIFDLIMNIVSITNEWFTENFGGIGTVVQNTFSGIETFWNEHLKPCFEAIGNFIQTVLAPAFELVFKNIILPLVKDTFNGIKNFWDRVLKPVFTGIIDFITGVFSGDWKKAFEGIISVAKGLLNGIKDLFMAPFEKAKNIVKSAIDKIKSYFNFEWSLPHLKMPHFNISGSFSLDPPSVPSFGIEWYKKGAVLKDPTVFGLNPYNGKSMVGGEAGDEAIAPIETLKRYIREAVTEKDTGVIDAITKGFEMLLAFLQQYIPELANMQLVMDSGALVGELAPGMDAELGRLADRDGRGAR